MSPGRRQRPDGVFWANMQTQVDAHRFSITTALFATTKIVLHKNAIELGGAGRTETGRRLSLSLCWAHAASRLTWQVRSPRTVGTVACIYLISSGRRRCRRIISSRSISAAASARLQLSETTRPLCETVAKQERHFSRTFSFCVCSGASQAAP